MKYIKTYSDNKLINFGKFLIDFLKNTQYDYNIEDEEDKISLFLYRYGRENIFFLKKYFFIGFNHFYFDKNDYVFNISDLDYVLIYYK